MPIGDIQIPVIGKEIIIVMLVMPHILIATFVIGITLIAPISEYMGLITKQPKYDRFARNAAKFTILIFVSGSALAITFIFALITLYPVFWSYMQNIFFWVLLAEAFMFVGEIALLYSWYNAWDRMAYRKRLHVIFGFMAGLFGVTQMTLINVVGAYMMTPSLAQATDIGWTYLNPTYMPLNMHRFAGNLSFVGFLIAGWAAWDRMAYRKRLHVIFGFMAGLFGVTQMTLINVVGAYMMTPSLASANDVGWTYLNPTYMPLNMHRFAGNLSFVGFLIAGWAAWRYLKSVQESDREYYDWMGHWGIVWGFSFLLLQPLLGYGYMKEIREHSPVTFEYLMTGDKAWLFNLLMIEVAIMAVASVGYFLHKLKFAVKPMPTLRNMTMGALGFTVLFSALLMIPADTHLVPQIGLVFFDGTETKIPLGAMYPYKYIGLIGMMLVGIVTLGLYLKATGSGFHWGRASRWSQYALMATAVTVVFAMMTMGYTRETARRAGEENWLIRGCITFDQQVVGEGCPAAPRDNP